MKYYKSLDVINMLRRYVHGAKRIEMLQYLQDKVVDIDGPAHDDFDCDEEYFDDDEFDND